MTDKKRRPPAEPNKLTPTYEDEIPIANKLTIAAHTDHERTILVRVPVGRAARKKTAKLLPLLGKLDFGEGEKNFDLTKVANVIGTLWSSDEFEDELVPFVLDMEDQDGQDYLEKLTLMEVLEAFMEATGIIMGGSQQEDFQEAVKKSTGEGGGDEVEEEVTTS